MKRCQKVITFIKMCTCTTAHIFPIRNLIQFEHLAIWEILLFHPFYSHNNPYMNSANPSQILIIFFLKRIEAMLQIKPNLSSCHLWQLSTAIVWIKSTSLFRHGGTLVCCSVIVDLIMAGATHFCLVVVMRWQYRSKVWTRSFTDFFSMFYCTEKESNSFVKINMTYI